MRHNPMTYATAISVSRKLFDSGRDRALNQRACYFEATEPILSKLPHQANARTLSLHRSNVHQSRHTMGPQCR
ncbi:hypothetical protein TNCV_3187041 [Trichonephila clavipes]|nr:hypothetical protein TNCV_3187041 [Trichonephila clavipes]